FYFSKQKDFHTSSCLLADTVMNGHEGNRATEHVNGNSSAILGSAVTRSGERLTLSPPNVRCARIRTSAKTYSDMRKHASVAIRS
ncbi:hypothetical protein TNCV_1091541, partial [Trichonephila clavipes]